MFGKTKITIKINGMDCEHCAHHVKTAIENLDGVEKADVNLRKGEAVVTLSKNNPATAEIIAQVVKGVGYEPVF
jgi:copper chaperone CopZ